jgi:hypothetical protein
MTTSATLQDAKRANLLIFHSTSPSITVTAKVLSLTTFYSFNGRLISFFDLIMSPRPQLARLHTQLSQSSTAGPSI